MRCLRWLAVLAAGCGSPTSRPLPPTPQPLPPRPAVAVARSTPQPRPSPKVSATPQALPPQPKPRKIVLPGPEKTLKPQLKGPEDPSSAASWRQYAEQCVKARAFSEASLAYAREAAIYRKKGDPEAASVEELKSDRYRTQIELFHWRPAQEPERPLARLEPTNGCMVGAFIDRDDSLDMHMFNPQNHGDIPQFNQRTGKDHASFFTYLSLSRQFPRQWCDYVRENGAIPHLAWEPRDLDQVTPDLIERFVDALVDYDGQVMIRFASEMNGDWTRYHADPARYRRVFRQVHQALRRAPKAALLWCPNAMPADNIDQYYPGDDGCDWVGVNFYSVLFLDNDPERPGDWIHPIDLLDSVYPRYAGRKPIAIGEYAASHQSVLAPTQRLDFARIKLAQLYQSLPLLYPQVKLISWYDCNNILKARSERQLNNFQLTDAPEVLADYHRWISDPWFLGAGQNSAALQARPFPRSLPGPVEVQPWVRSYEPNPQVFLRLDGQVVQVQQLPESARYRLPHLRMGKHKLEVLVYDPAGRFVGKRLYPFVID